MYGVPERELLPSYSERTQFSQFMKRKQSHNHPTVTGAVTATKILTAVKEQAVQDFFRPASAIVEEVSMQNK